MKLGRWRRHPRCAYCRKRATAFGFLPTCDACTAWIRKLDDELAKEATDG